jgi:hypothetical protein
VSFDSYGEQHKRVVVDEDRGYVLFEEETEISD